MSLGRELNNSQIKGKSKIGNNLPVYGSLYDRRFVNDIPIDFQCPICYDNIISCQVNCRHAFCVGCLENYIHTRFNKQLVCPICRKDFSHFPIVRICGDLLNRAKDLVVMCLGETNGCTVSLPLKEIVSHEGQCPFVTVVCSFRYKGCMYICDRSTMRHHIDRCRFNPEVKCCKYFDLGCKIRGTSRLLEYHEKRCSKRNTNIFVNCKYSSHGCGIKIRKSCLSIHEEYCMFEPEYQQKATTTQKVIFEIALAKLDGGQQIDFNEIQKELSKIYPKISRLEQGPMCGEFKVIIEGLPLSAFFSIGLSSNVNITKNLTDLKLIKKGIYVYNPE